MGNYERKNVKSKTVVIVAAVAVALLLSLAVYTIIQFTRQSKNPAETDQPVSTGIIYDDSAIEGSWETMTHEEIEAALNQKVEEGMINISCNTAPVFADGKAEGNVMLVNEAINNYPQKVEFIRNDTNEKIYASKAIPVGSKIEKAALDVELDAGSYDCTAMFYNLDPDTGDALGCAGAIINITIQN